MRFLVLLVLLAVEQASALRKASNAAKPAPLDGTTADGNLARSPPLIWSASRGRWEERRHESSDSTLKLVKEDFNESTNSLIQSEGDIVPSKCWPKYELKWVKQLGEGHYGSVHLIKAGCSKSPYGHVAMKVVRRDSASKYELSVMEKLKGSSDYVMSLAGDPPSCEHGSKFYILMEYLNQGDLLDHVNNFHADGTYSGSRVPVGLKGLEVQLALWVHACTGTKVIHEKGFVHMDLKPENILVNCRDLHCYAAVIDLGLACVMHNTDGECGPRGTLTYMAPEVADSNTSYLAHPANDVWSLGVVLFVQLFKNLPAYYASDLHTREELLRTWDIQQEAATRLNHKGITEEKDPFFMKCVSLLYKTLAKDPSKRPSVDEIITIAKGYIAESRNERAKIMVTMDPKEDVAKYEPPSCVTGKMRRLASKPKLSRRQHSGNRRGHSGTSGKSHGKKHRPRPRSPTGMVVEVINEVPEEKIAKNSPSPPVFVDVGILFNPRHFEHNGRSFKCCVFKGNEKRTNIQDITSWDDLPQLGFCFVTAKTACHCMFGYGWESSRHRGGSCLVKPENFTDATGVSPAEAFADRRFTEAYANFRS